MVTTSKTKKPNLIEFRINLIKLLTNDSQNTKGYLAVDYDRYNGYSLVRISHENGRHLNAFYNTISACQRYSKKEFEALLLGIISGLENNNQ
jgi:hypothetical protein